MKLSLLGHRQTAHQPAKTPVQLFDFLTQSLDKRLRFRRHFLQKSFWNCPAGQVVRMREGLQRFFARPAAGLHGGSLGDKRGFKLSRQCHGSFKFPLAPQFQQPDEATEFTEFGAKMFSKPLP